MSINIWVNVYKYRGNYECGKTLHTTCGLAFKNIQFHHKQYYKHTINVETGEIKIKDWKNE